MQVIFKSTKLLTEAKLFFESLANIQIPYIGVGTFQLSKLSWSTEEARISSRISSPFNKVAFFSMQPLTTLEMAAIIEEYNKDWNSPIPDPLQLSIISEPGGHAASLMALLRLYDECQPTIKDWRLTLQTYYELFMNGVQKKIT